MYTGEHTHINTAGLIYEYYYSISSSDNINIKMVKRKLVYMCETCGKTEKDFTSKKIEAMHQYVYKRLTRSNYVVKDVTSDIHGEKLHKGINHINSYNLSN